MFLCSFLFLLHRDGVNEDRQGQKDPNTLSWRATLLRPLCLHYGKSMLGKNTEHLSHIYSLALWAGKQHDGWHENFLEAPPFSLSSPFCHLTSLTHQQSYAPHMSWQQFHCPALLSSLATCCRARATWGLLEGHSFSPSNSVSPFQQPGWTSLAFQYLLVPFLSQDRWLLLRNS